MGNRAFTLVCSIYVFNDFEGQNISYWIKAYYINVFCLTIFIKRNELSHFINNRGFSAKEKGGPHFWRVRNHCCHYFLMILSFNAPFYARYWLHKKQINCTSTLNYNKLGIDWIHQNYIDMFRHDCSTHHYKNTSIALCHDNEP